MCKLNLLSTMVQLPGVTLLDFCHLYQQSLCLFQMHFTKSYISWNNFPRVQFEAKWWIGYFDAFNIKTKSDLSQTCALYWVVVYTRGLKPYAQTFIHLNTRYKPCLLHDDKNKLDQVSFKAESTKTKQVSDYIIYILSNTTVLMGSEPTRE